MTVPTCGDWKDETGEVRCDLEPGHAGPRHYGRDRLGLWTSWPVTGRRGRA